MRSKTKGRGTSKTKGVNTTECCALCGLSTNDPDQFGEMVTLKQHKLTVHYFCLLTSSGVYQRGGEDEGVFGFLVDDIKQEIHRSSRLTCMVCKRKGASVGCFVKSCRRMVHFPCGKKHQFIFQFTDLFQSYCKDHSPTQSFPVSSDFSLPQSCSICLDTIEPVLSYSVLKCPACHTSWFHRDCVQHQAHSAGLFFFRCTLCNNKNSFQEEMLRMGIHIPERDASWELEENAFEELLEVYQQCDAPDCLCINGRTHSAKTGWFEVLRCALCGSRGTHRKCSGLKVDTTNWACEDCTEAVDGKASLVPRASPQSGGQRRSLLSKRRLSSIHSAVSCKRPSLSGDSSPEEILQALALQLVSPQNQPQAYSSPQASPESSPHPSPQATIQSQIQPQPQDLSSEPETQPQTQPPSQIQTHSPQLQPPLLTLLPQPQFQDLVLLQTQSQMLSPQQQLSQQAYQLMLLQQLPSPSPNSQPTSQPSSQPPSQPQPSTQSHSQLVCTQLKVRIPSLLHQRLISSYFQIRSSEPEPQPSPQPQPQIYPSPQSQTQTPSLQSPPLSPKHQVQPEHPPQAPPQTIFYPHLQPQCISQPQSLNVSIQLQRLRQHQPQPQTPSPQPETNPQPHPSPQLQPQAPSNPVVVTGDQALSAGLTLVKRSNFNPTHHLSVRFKDGNKLPFPSCPGSVAAKRSFLKLLVEQIQESVVFEGPPGAKNLALDSQALREDLYFEVGCLLAVSLVHGGPPLCFLSPALYQCLFNYPRDTPLTVTHITHSRFALRINRIMEARSLEDLKEAMEACRECLELAGCNRPVSTLEDKHALVEDLVSFAMITRMQLPLQRFREGLKTLGVFEQVQMFPAVFYRLFCGPAEHLTAETLAGLFTVNFSDQQDRQDRETPVATFWRHLLVESEVGRSSISLQDILLFATGADMVPALGFQPPPSLSFIHSQSLAEERGRRRPGGMGEKDGVIDICCPGKERSRAKWRDGRKDVDHSREKRRGGLRSRWREASPPAEEGERDGTMDVSPEGEEEERDGGEDVDHPLEDRRRDEKMEEGVRDGWMEKGVFPQSQPGSNQLSLPVVSSYLAFKSSMEQAISHSNRPAENNLTGHQPQ